MTDTHSSATFKTNQGKSLLRIGILGAARVAEEVMIIPARAIDRAEVVAVAARDVLRAKAYGAAHGIPRVHETYADLINDPGIDLIYIATPPALHAQQAMAAIRAGKPVLVEKPFAMNALQAQAVLELSKECGVPVFEGMHSPHHKLFGRLLEVIDRGEIGQVKRISAEFNVPIPDEDPIRWKSELGGGALMDLGVYPLAWSRRIAGEEFIVTMSTAEMDGSGADASFSAKLEFANGVVAEVSSSMRKGPWASIIVEGSNGRIFVVNPIVPQLGHALIVVPGFLPRTETFDATPSTFESQLLAVCSTMLDGMPFPYPLDDYVRSMRAIDAVRAVTVGISKGLNDRKIFDDYS